MLYQTKHISKVGITKFISWLIQDKLFAFFSLLILLICSIMYIPSYLLQSSENKVGFLIIIYELGVICIIIVLITIFFGILCKLFVYILFGKNEAFKEKKLLGFLFFIILIEGSLIFIQTKEQLNLSNHLDLTSYLTEIAKLMSLGMIFGIILVFTFLAIFGIILRLLRSFFESQTREEVVSRIEKTLKNKKFALSKLKPQKESIELYPIVLTSLSRLLTITSMLSILMFAYLEFFSDLQRIEFFLLVIAVLMFIYSIIFTQQMRSIVILHFLGYVEIFQQTQGRHIQGNQYFLIPEWYKFTLRDIDYFEIILKMIVIIPLISKIPYYYMVLNSLPVTTLLAVPLYFGFFLVGIVSFYLEKKKRIAFEAKKCLPQVEELIKKHTILIKAKSL